MIVVVVEEKMMMMMMMMKEEEERIIIVVVVVGTSWEKHKQHSPRPAQSCSKKHVQQNSILSHEESKP